MVDAATSIECIYCGNKLHADEAENPYRDTDGDVMCDECYHDHYEFTCAWCDEYDHVDHQHVLLVVFDAKAFSEWAQEQGYTAGVYRIVGRPYCFAPMIGQGELRESALERIADLPAGIKAGWYPCGHLCRGCQAKIMKGGANG